MTMGWLEMYQFWGWQGRDLKLYTLWAHLSRRVRRCKWRWTGRGGLTTCSNTQVSNTKEKGSVRSNSCTRLNYDHVLLHTCSKLQLFSSWLLGQHLITALADTFFGYKTTSWYITALIPYPVTIKTCAFTSLLSFLFVQGTGASEKHHWTGHALCEACPAPGPGGSHKLKDQSPCPCYCAASLYRWSCCGKGAYTDIVLIGVKIQSSYCAMTQKSRF